MHLYGKPQEKRDIQFLESLGYEVINPSDPSVQEAMRKYQEEHKGENTMEFFYDLIINCQLVAFRAHPDLKIPAGVASEVSYALGLSLPIIELPNLTSARFLTITETRYYLELLGER